MQDADQLTRLLDAAGRGDERAQADLYDLIYAELRRMAAAQMDRESPGHTLQPSILVHDIFVRLVASGRQSWENRRHFFGAAAQAMRRILIDHARARDAKKRRAPGERITLENVADRCASGELDFEALDEAMSALAAQYPRQAEVVRMKFLLGMTTSQIADAIGVSTRTVEGDWAFARAELLVRISDAEAADPTV